MHEFTALKNKTEERRPCHQIHNPIKLAYELSQEMNNLSIQSKLHLVHLSAAKKSKNYFKTIFIETTLSLHCSSSFCSSPHSSEKAIRAAAATVRTHSNYRELFTCPATFVHYFNFSSLVLPSTNDYVDKLEFIIVEGQQHKRMQCLKETIRNHGRREMCLKLHINKFPAEEMYV